MNAIKKLTLIFAAFCTASAWASVEVTGFEVSEAAGTGTWNVTVSVEGENPVSNCLDGYQLDYSTRDGTAEDENGDNDYTSRSGTLDFTDSCTQQINVPIIQDGKIEGDENLYVDLYGAEAIIPLTSGEQPEGKEPTPIATGEGTIIDDDIELTVFVEFQGGGGGPVDIFLDCNGNGTIDDDTKTTSGGQAVFEVINYVEPLDCTAVPVSTPSGQAPVSSDCNPGMDEEDTECLIVFAPTRVTFTVQKLFMMGHEADEVEVNISCNTGLPLEQTHTAPLVPGPLGSPKTYETEFVVNDFDDGELDCTVFETPVDGYIPSYNCDNDVGGTCDAGDEFDVYSGEFVDDFLGGDPDDFYDGPCEYEDVSVSIENYEDEKPWETLCVIRNYPAPVEVEIDKLWVLGGTSSSNDINTDYRIELWCDTPIIDAGFGQPTSEEAESAQGGYYNFGVYWEVFGYDEPFDFGQFASVIPGYPASNCEVQEYVYDAAIEVDNDCGDSDNEFQLTLGNDYQCAITNTIFYEGIPTLNHYGLALLALLMLGVGFVGFRRYS